MVSFHKSLSPTRRKTITEWENSTKKRKWEEPQVDHEKVFEKQMKAQITKSIFDTELNLETPLPLEWQRCLDIKSGHIHYYNVRTQKRTSNDPRITPEPPTSPDHTSLDLELNLLCGSLSTKNLVGDNFSKNNSGSSSNNSGDPFLNYCRKSSKKNSGGLSRCPSWLAFELGDQSERETEMITAVCNKCYMLVMMCKSSPACPNCKFIHPPDQSPPNLLKPRLSFLC